MALRGIQEYIARDANNIARVEDEVEGQYVLVYPEKEPPNTWTVQLYSILKLTQILIKNCC